MMEPHGGKLVNRVKKESVGDIPEIEVIECNAREWADLELIGIGVLSPLEGFMNEKNYISTIENMILENGVVWSIPITLSITDELKEKIKKKDFVYISFRGRVWGRIFIEDIFKARKEEEAEKVYGTLSEEHPSVAYLKKIGNWYVGGKVEVFDVSDFGFPDEFLTPAQTRKIFHEKRWKKIVAFQTRNPPHRAHEYIQKCALEICDGLFINPIVGETKEDDVPADVRIKAYKVVIDKYYNKERVILGVLPSAMRYGGPREAIHHAIMRKNFGCTHFIVGRDHAGVGNFYGPYDAQKIFEKVDVGITPLPFENSFWCPECKNMSSSKTCQHKGLSISGTQLRKMLSEGKIPPEEYIRPEVAKILIEYYSS